MDRTVSWADQQKLREEQLSLVVQTFDKQTDKYLGILPSSIPIADFRNAFLIAVQTNNRLLEADRQSLWLALQKAASMGLKPDGQEGALVIFGDDDEDGQPSQANQKKRVVWMPMVWGLTKLVRNTGSVASIRAKLIYRGEKIIVNDENGVESYRHVRTYGDGDEVDESDANITGAYAVCLFKDGSWEFEAMTRRQLERVRAVSKAKKASAPWQTWFSEQCKKTVLRRLEKRLPKSRDLQVLHEAITADETTIEGEAEDVTVQQQISQEFAAPLTLATAPEKETVGPVKQATDKVETRRRAPRGERKAESPPEKPISKEPAPSIGSMFADEEPAEVHPVDEYGEVGGEPMTLQLFAHWYADRIMKSSNPQALFENNADNLDQIKEDQQLQALVETAQAERWRLDHIQPDRNPVMVRMVGGKMNEAHYREASKAEIANLTDLDDMADWVAVNKANYTGKAVEIGIEHALAVKREEWNAPETAEPEPVEEVAAPTEPPDMNGKTSAHILEYVRSTLPNLTTEEEVLAWGSHPNLKPSILAMRKADPERFRDIVRLIDEKTAQLKGATP